MIRTYTPMNNSHAMVEAQRCLGCYQAPCQQACPAHVDVPGFIRRFKEENLAGAAELIYSACPLGNICGQACPTGDLCEKACVLSDMGQAPIRIGSLQALITSTCHPGEKPFSPPTGKRVAVVGAGPAGLGCAVQLNRQGIEVHVYESHQTPGGLVARVIPAHRLPQSTVEIDLERLKNSGIQIHFSTPVDASLTDELLKQFDAVFVGTGLTSEVQPELAQGSASGIFSALPVLEAARSGRLTGLGQRVIVVGGGNVALDAAVVAKRSGVEQVILLYRRGKSEMPGWESEYLEACELGVEFRWLSVVQKIITQPSSHGSEQVTGVEVTRMRYSPQTKNGRRWVELDPSQSPYFQSCDAVVFAMGQTLDPKMAQAFGISIQQGLFAAEPSTYQTSTPRIFAAGEAVTGGSTIIASLSAGMAAARSIHEFLLQPENRERNRAQ